MFSPKAKICREKFVYPKNRGPGLHKGQVSLTLKLGTSKLKGLVHPSPFVNVDKSVVNWTIL